MNHYFSTYNILLECLWLAIKLLMFYKDVLYFSKILLLRNINLQIGNFINTTMTENYCKINFRLLMAVAIFTKVQ